MTIHISFLQKQHKSAADRLALAKKDVSRLQDEVRQYEALLSYLLPKPTHVEIAIDERDTFRLFLISSLDGRVWITTSKFDATKVIGRALDTIGAYDPTRTVELVMRSQTACQGLASALRAWQNTGGRETDRANVYGSTAFEKCVRFVVSAQSLIGVASIVWHSTTTINLPPVVGEPQGDNWREISDWALHMYLKRVMPVVGDDRPWTEADGALHDLRSAG